MTWCKHFGVVVGDNTLTSITRCSVIDVQIQMHTHTPTHTPPHTPTHTHTQTHTHTHTLSLSLSLSRSLSLCRCSIIDNKIGVGIEGDGRVNLHLTAFNNDAASFKIDDRSRYTAKVCQGSPCVCGRALACTDASAHTDARTYRFTYGHAHTRTQTHTHTHTHTHVGTCMHTSIHTYSDVHTRVHGPIAFTVQITG